MMDVEMVDAWAGEMGSDSNLGQASASAGSVGGSVHHGMPNGLGNVSSNSASNVWNGFLQEWPLGPRGPDTTESGSSSVLGQGPVLPLFHTHTATRTVPTPAVARLPPVGQGSAQARHSRAEHAQLPPQPPFDPSALQQASAQQAHPGHHRVQQGQQAEEEGQLAERRAAREERQRRQTEAERQHGFQHQQQPRTEQHQQQQQHEGLGAAAERHVHRDRHWQQRQQHRRGETSEESDAHAQAARAASALESQERLWQQARERGRRGENQSRQRRRRHASSNWEGLPSNGNPSQHPVANMANGSRRGPQSRTLPFVPPQAHELDLSNFHTVRTSNSGNSTEAAVTGYAPRGAAQRAGGGARPSAGRAPAGGAVGVADARQPPFGPQTSPHVPRSQGVPSGRQPAASKEQKPKTIQGTPAAALEEGGEKEQCPICWDAPSDTVCVPCGHIAGCHACLSRIFKEKKQCPGCRQALQCIVKTYKM